MIACETYNGIAVLNANRPDWNPRGRGFDPDWLPDGRTFGVQRRHRAARWCGVDYWLADEDLRQERPLSSAAHTRRRRTGGAGLR
jgi:hypothetical protein